MLLKAIAQAHHPPIPQLPVFARTLPFLLRASMHRDRRCVPTLALRAKTCSRLEIGSLSVPAVPRLVPFDSERATLPTFPTLATKPPFSVNVCDVATARCADNRDTEHSVCEMRDSRENIVHTRWRISPFHWLLAKERSSRRRLQQFRHY